MYTPVECSYIDLVKYNCFKTNLPVTTLSNVKTRQIKWSYLLVISPVERSPSTNYINACFIPKSPFEGCRSFRFAKGVVQTPPLVLIFLI
jgi:hypothetical protein